MSKQITISLEEYLNKSCRGIEQVEVIDEQRASLLKSIDPEESFLHVEPLEHNNLSKVYRIQDWKTSVERDKAVKRQSEERIKKYNEIKEKEQEWIRRKEKAIEVIRKKTGCSQNQALFMVEQFMERANQGNREGAIKLGLIDN